MPAGRPLKFKAPEELQKAVDSYFEAEKHVTMSGLAVHIGIDRRSLINYADRDEFFPIIKSARDKVESHYEKLAIYDGQPTGVIFALKNMGWTDRQALDHTTKGEKIQAPIQWVDSGEST